MNGASRAEAGRARRSGRMRLQGVAKRMSTETKVAAVRARGEKVVAVVWLRWWGSSKRIRQEPEASER